MGTRKKILESDSSSEELTDFEKTFLDLYFENGFNARNAMVILKPESTLHSCDEKASRILKLGKSQAYIAERHELMRKKSEISLEYIVGNLKKIIEEVNDEGEERADGKLIMRKDRKSQLAAIQQLSKIAGFETKKIEQTITADVSVKKLFGFEEENDKAE